jgi:SHS2 domain-containing protein
MKKIKQDFEFFDVTADIGIIAFGNTLNESFENAGLAMFNVISDTTNVAKNKEFKFFIESEDEVSLLYDFLEELLILHEINFMLFSDFKVEIKKINNNFRLDAIKEVVKLKQ